MKKKWKTLVSLALAFALCVSMTTMAFAAETNSGSDVSLEDILGLLSSLTTDETEEVIEEEIADGTLEEIPEGTTTLHGVSFVLPDDMIDLGEMEDGSVAFIDSSFSKVAAFSFFEASPGEDFSLDNELNQRIMIAGITGEGSDVADYTLSDFNGYNVLEIEFSREENGLLVQGLAYVIELEDGLFVAAFSSSDSDLTDLYNAFTGSLRVGGAAAPSDTPASGKDTLGQGTGSSTAEVPEDAIDATLVDEVVLLDDDLCKVSLKSFEQSDDSWYGYTVKVYAENKSDQDLRFSADYICLNDYVVSAYWGEDVSAGHKSNSELGIYPNVLEENNITEVNELSLMIRVMDDSYNDIEKAFFTILPNGSNVPAQPEQTFPDDAQILVDNDVITMIITGDQYSDDYDTIIPVYIENHTDQFINISAYGSSAVNGYEIAPFIFGSIPGGKKINTSIEWDNDELADNDIEIIEDVELDLEVNNAEDWAADDLYAEMISFQLN